VNIFFRVDLLALLPPQNRRYAPESGPTGRRPALLPWATALNRCAIVAVRLAWGALTRSEIVDSDARGGILKIDASSTSFKIVVTHEYRFRHRVAPRRQRRKRRMTRPSTCAVADGRSMRVSALRTMRFASRYPAAWRRCAMAQRLSSIRSSSSAAPLSRRCPARPSPRAEAQTNTIDRKQPAVSVASRLQTFRTSSSSRR
jgi:hypothetical protein